MDELSYRNLLRDVKETKLSLHEKLVEAAQFLVAFNSFLVHVLPKLP